jgi:energy-coupling factor transporter ATP-binding protein EcfA2
MKTLNEVDGFGAIDADNDELLFSCFENHQAYLSIRKRHRFLILGRKGCGKTAIFKHLLALRQHDVFSYGHTFSDYPWHHHDLQSRAGIPDFDRFTHSWKYLILMSLSKIVLNQDQSLPFDELSMERMEKIERFVIDSYGSRNPDLSQLFTPTKTLKLKPYFEINFKLLKAGVSSENVPITELPTIVQDVNRALTDYILQSLNAKHEYFICFDQLDLGFDPTKPDYGNRLIGLLLAARDINQIAKSIGKQLFVVIFLREDIYDSLQFEDKNKLTENYASRIAWDLPTTTNTLKSLMEKRFDVVLSSETGEKIGWERVFDESALMSGRQTKYAHLLDRTYLRPRDMIKLCNAALDQFKIRAGNKPHIASDKITNEDIITARNEYGQYFLKELDDEIHKHVPHYKSHLELLRALGVQSFEREKFIEVCQKRPEFTMGEQPMQILQKLYQFSIVGFYRAGGKGLGGSEYVFQYKATGTAFDSHASKFRVHTGLIDALGLKKFTWGGAVAEDEQEE